jgi:hypothetical protein
MSSVYNYYQTGKGLLAENRDVLFAPENFDSYVVGSVRQVIADLSRPSVQRLAVYSQNRQMWIGLYFDGGRYVGGSPINSPRKASSRISVDMPELKNLPSRLLEGNDWHDMCVRFDAHTMHYLERSRELLGARNVCLGHMEVDMNKKVILNNATLVHVIIPANHLMLIVVHLHVPNTRPHSVLLLRTSEMNCCIDMCKKSGTTRASISNLLNVDSKHYHLVQVQSQGEEDCCNAYSALAARIILANWKGDSEVIPAVVQELLKSRDQDSSGRLIAWLMRDFERHSQENSSSSSSSQSD